MADDEWEYELEDLSDDGGREDGTEGRTDPSEVPVEPEPWSLESAAFVALGVAVTLFVFLRFAVG